VNELSEQIQSLEWLAASRDAAIQLWRASMLSLAEALPPTPRQIADPHRKGLRQVTEESPNNATLKKATEIISSYGNQMGNYLDSQDKEIRAVLNSIAQLTDRISSSDQRYALKLQGIARKLRQAAASGDLTRIESEVTALERLAEQQQREIRIALQRMNEEITQSEVRRQRALPGPGSQHASDSLITLERAVEGWDHYCLVRYEFQSRPGVTVDHRLWATKQAAVLEALPERVGYNVKVVIPKPGILLAAVHCQLLDYACQAEAMEKSLSQLAGALCSSRVVEPVGGEAMREAMARLEKAG
jgi:hypothetical protein